jgi:DNA-binding GntR family transcriptional regulator
MAKYQSVYEDLRRRIEGGNHPVGSRLPTEDELAERYRVSRVTVRRSLDILVSEGYLQRRQGSGYSVLTLSPPRSNCLTSFTDAMLRAGRVPSSRLISLGQLTLDDETLSRLPARFADEEPVGIERLRLVDGKPEMLVRTFLPRELVSRMSATDFPETGSDQSILRILKNRFRLDWGAACEDISAFAATPEIAEHLGIAVGVPILKQVCTAFSEHGEMVFYEQLFRGGTVSFELSSGARSIVFSSRPSPMVTA